jgi:integrase
MAKSNERKQKTSGRNQKEKPITFKRGSFTGTIYKTSREMGGQTYTVFRYSYYQPDGKRVLKDSGSMERAQQILEDAAQAFGRAQPDALSFTPEQRRDADAAIEILAPFKLTLYTAASQLTEALLALPAGMSLMDAVRFAVQRNPSNGTAKLVHEVVAELVQDRESNGRSDKYLSDLRKRLQQFANAFPCSIANISPSQIRQHIATMKGQNSQPLAARSRENHRRLIVTLFSFASQQRYVSRDTAAEIAEIQGPRVVAPQTEIFKPEQIQRILNASTGTDRVLLAIGAFCGLRAAELGRLTWECIKWDQQVVVVGADMAKTQSRRVVPLSQNAIAWIAPIFNESLSGKISRYGHADHLSRRFAEIANQVNVEWVRNGLRHSFCSYRLAQTKNAAQTAHEAGNSPSILHRHYSELVTQQEAEQWFTVIPNQ